ncbi:hypothetical protein BOW53_07160 [Solemya pervernicosa gill symbiont]|uniref:Uncharacterized protein n=1 Tax=Solemya pervernicosa gill symbiont TaxID=642797 RepID=A0A1T2L640_9GAMM|nr:hypothetical protein [Solemya pervernicosa gill symbiont]OOZ40553.1 hypothetical protein BOW53_07160 [Solemya pervernicosa gill symbiont]
MISLTKNNSDWTTWTVNYNGNYYAINNPEHSSKYDNETFFFPEGDTPTITISDIGQLNFSSLPKELILRLNNRDDSLGKHVDELWIDCRHDKVRLKYIWTIKTAEWNTHINPLFLRTEIANQLKQINETSKRYISIEESTDSIEFIDLLFDVTADYKENIGKTINTIKDDLNSATETANTNASLGGFANKITANFTFDESVQVACTRYLQYFIEFLNDLGIPSNSHITNKGDDTLFCIEPTDKQSSLRAIADALALYLNLPETNISQHITDNIDPLTELRIEKLNSEISKLKSDINLNQAIIKLQQHQLDTQNTPSITSSTNHKGTTPLDGLRTVVIDNNTESSQEFFQGVIKLGSFKKAGIEFNWNALVKLVTNRYK